MKDLYGDVLYETTQIFPTEAETLSSSMNEMIAYFQTTSEASSIMEPLEITGCQGEHYYGVTATIRAKSGQIYMLEIFYPKTLYGKFLEPTWYPMVWFGFSSFLCIVLLSRFLIKRAFEPTEKILKGQKGLRCGSLPRTKITTGSDYNKCGKTSRYYLAG